jgi:drug/metabolite transporter (DMT)-like permease
MSVTALFLVPVLIWGSTWYAITWQFGVVAPEVSVTYRFALASLLLAAGCVATGRRLRFSGRDHAFLAGAGFLMIALNYNLIYWAEGVVVSGLVAVLFATMVFMMPIGMRIAFGTPIRARLLAAAALGVSGVTLLYLPELERGVGESALWGGTLTLLATLACTVGNLMIVRNNNAKIPTVQGTTWTLGYGALFSALLALAAGVPWTFDASARYVVSLAYLAVCGSVIAFVTYFALLKRVGPGPSSYTTIATPVIAILISTLFEGYRWTPTAVAGMALAVAGITLAVRSR